MQASRRGAGNLAMWENGAASMNNDERDMLDNPAWASLANNLSRLGEGGPLARRFHADVSPFGGVIAPEPENLDALGALLGPGQSVMLIATGKLPDAATVESRYLFDVLQMIDAADSLGETDDEARPLTSDDASDMLALAKRTNPGPFGARTGDMGAYIGIRRGGRLIGMAGERLQFGRYVEISAVCVDVEFRGQGLAQRMMNGLRRDIRARGGAPFLHVRTDAQKTAQLYEAMGFVPRRTLNLYAVTTKPVA